MLHCQTRRARLAPAALVLVTAVVVLSQNARVFLRSRARAVDPDQASLVQYLHDHTAPSDTVLMWTEGRDGELLLRVNRPPGVRHFMAHSYFDMDLALFAELVIEFVAKPPLWIVQDTRRKDPLLTGPAHCPWEASIPALQQIQQFVREHYHWEASFGRFEVWRRAGPPGTAPSD
jgi:hypothetical protein